MLANIVVEAAQNIFAAIDQRHFAAQPGEDAGEFDGDITAALDDDALRQFCEMKRLVRRDDMFEARNFRSHMRPAAGGNQDGLGANFGAGREAQCMLVFDDSARANELDFVAFKRGDIGRFQPIDFAILIGDQGRPTECRLLRHGPAETGRVLELVAEARGIDQQLLRHAATDHAGAADAEFLGHHHPGAIARRDARRANATGASSDDEQIDLRRIGDIVCHLLQSPARAKDA
jgi:hypothetical protein